MKKKVCIITSLIVGSMVMSCASTDLAPVIVPAVKCFETLARMTQIQIELDDPSKSEGERALLIAEYADLENFAEKNCPSPDAFEGSDTLTSISYH